MKTTIVKSAFLVTLFAGILAGCVNDDDYETPTLAACSETSLVKNREVSEIGATSAVALHQSITPGVSDIIEAYVTSSDIGGNFFKSISFQTLDGTKAFSIPVDATSTFINYEPGRKVLINLDGLYTDVNDGGVRLGGLFANSSGGAEVGRLPESQFRTSVQRSCTSVTEEQLVQRPASIEATITNDAYINKLIEFNNVEISNCDAFSTYYEAGNDVGGATNHLLVDKAGNKVVMRISSFSNFAAKPTATGSGKVRGVMTKFGTTYQFMVRSLSDIDLTGPRFVPALNEGFDGLLAACTGFTTFSVTGSQTWYADPGFGKPKPCVVMSGFSGSAQANEDWLISPAQNLSTATSATFFSFDNAKNFTGNAIEVLVSNNYSGTDSPNAAGVVWTPLTGYTLSGGTFAWVNSGQVSLPAGYIGAGNNRVYFAFKYTSTSSAAATWEIDNIRLSIN